MKLVRSGSTLFATGVQASSSNGITGAGRTLDVASSHLSGNTYFDIVTNNSDGAEWTMVGDMIKVAVSSSTNSQYSDRLDHMISYRFWDTGVKVSDNPGCMISMSTYDGMLPHATDTHEVYMAIGFVTAPSGSISDILIGQGDGDAASTATSWSSLRWFGLKWQDDSAQSLNVTTRQGENTFSWGSDLKPKKTVPTDYTYHIAFTGLLAQRLDHQWEWTESSTIVNYPHTDASGDAEFVGTLATDTPIGTNGEYADHHIYAFISVGRGSAGDSGEQSIQARYKIYVG